ncbi:MAG: hypothetical protein NCW75_10365 [Phycisphaera sp.]|nr:MAG: hypothetical protein NCW75_10365 [Phycisphaera sp.]
MIFVTVGAQMAFDRLVRAVDQWAKDAGRSDVFAQIGPAEYTPEHIEHVGFLEPPEFTERARAASVIVAHAGMGSIITALTMGKPILVMPRRGDLRETRNDHQIATAQRLSELGKVAVAMDETELVERLGRLDDLASTGTIGPYAQDSLIAAVRGVVFPSQDR